MSYGFKPCSKCARVLPLEAFSKDKNRHGGYCPKCKDCYKAYREGRKDILNAQRRAYRVEHGEEVRAKARAYHRRQRNRPRHLANKRAWYHANREKIHAKKSAWYHANKEQVLAAQKAYYEANRDEISARAAARYEANRDQEQAKRREYYKRNADTIKGRVSTYRHTEAGRRIGNEASARRYAAKKAMPETLTVAQWHACLAWWEHRCAYCGKAGERLHQEHYIPLSKGGGYVVANIVPACPSCNSSKATRMPEMWVMPEVRAEIATYFGVVVLADVAST